MLVASSKCNVLKGHESDYRYTCDSMKRSKETLGFKKKARWIFLFLKDFMNTYSFFIIGKKDNPLYEYTPSQKVHGSLEFSGLKIFEF